jgi:broad specificity phosphatase PhoE
VRSGEIVRRFWWWLWPVVVLVPAVALVYVERSCGEPATRVFIVRHAEKVRPGSDPPLTPEGRERARELARVVAKAAPSAVFATEYQRTQQTVQPLADVLSLAVVEVGAKDVQQLADSILGDHAGETVVVAGHSNTVHLVIAALGGPTVPEIPDDEFDNLFIVTVRCDGDVEMMHLEYGAP